MVILHLGINKMSGIFFSKTKNLPKSIEIHTLEEPEKKDLKTEPTPSPISDTSKCSFQNSLHTFPTLSMSNDKCLE